MEITEFENTRYAKHERAKVKHTFSIELIGHPLTYFMEKYAVCWIMNPEKTVCIWVQKTKRAISKRGYTSFYQSFPFMCRSVRAFFFHSSYHQRRDIWLNRRFKLDYTIPRGKGEDLAHDHSLTARIVTGFFIFFVNTLFFFPSSPVSI